MAWKRLIAPMKLRRSVRAGVPSGVMVDKGRFFIHIKRWAVKRRIAGAGTNCRLAKNCEYKTSYAKPDYKYLVFNVLIEKVGPNNHARRIRPSRYGQRKCT